MCANFRKPCRILVTGAGSGVGQGIVKALRISGLPITIISGDISPMNAALYRADEAVMIPKVEVPGSLEALINIIRESKINIVMIGSEYELLFFAANRALLESATGALVIVAPMETVEIADDKWLTAEFLRKAGIAYAESYLPGDIDDAVKMASAWGYPIILKSRTGTSSRNVHLIADDPMLRRFFASTPRPMLQKVIAIPSDELGSEYTCSVFKTRDGQLLGPFTARRTVRGGSSWHIEVARFENLNGLLMAIANTLPFDASLNVQLMVSAHGPVPFELNSRFSGTTAIRAHFGFNEPEMTVRSYFYNEMVEAPVIRSGVAMRYLEEVFVESAEAGSLVPGKSKGLVRPWF